MPRPSPSLTLSPTTTTTLQSSAQDIASPAFMYVRVKRERACVFLRCAPGERVGALKARIEALTQQVRGGGGFVCLSGQV
jgi:hypothetical protein